MQGAVCANIVKATKFDLSRATRCAQGATTATAATAMATATTDRGCLNWFLCANFGRAKCDAQGATISCSQWDGLATSPLALHTPAVAKECGQRGEGRFCQVVKCPQQQQQQQLPQPAELAAKADFQSARQLRYALAKKQLAVRLEQCTDTETHTEEHLYR